MVTSSFITRKLVDYAQTGPRAGVAAFVAGTGSFPYLTDHGFQGMVVLPGTFFVEMALCVQLECLRVPAVRLKQVEFLNPVILSGEDITLTARVDQVDDQTVRYTFYEAADREIDALSVRPCARLEVESGNTPPADAGKMDVVVDAFQQRANDMGDPAGFYRQLRGNGNQYGPRFQTLRHVWRSNQEALGRLRVPAQAMNGEAHHLHPILLDGVAQLMSVFKLDQGRTFILQGAESITIPTADLPGEVWVHGRLHPANETDGSGLTGDLDVFDDAGTRLLQVRKVRFTYLDRIAPDDNAATAKTPVVIAATFTAEPVEDSLRFWGEYLGLPVQVDFAPYNQVFQELLNPESNLRRNRAGFNVVLLNPGDWMADGRAAGLKVDPEKAAVSFAGLERHVLANGMEVAHLNRHETEYVYKEIFEDQVYLRHGIQLKPDATVIDIGANIGLFSLFVRSRAAGATLYSFEPSPIAFRALKANCDSYGPGLNPFNVGVSERRGSAKLTFYEKSSVFSSFHSDAAEDRKAIQAVVENMVRSELGNSAGSVDDYVQDLMADRLDQQTFDCPLVSVSDIIRDNRLSRVNLLKVDAEKCELEILRGIDEAHWPLIEQIVIEVHDRTRQLVTEVQDILVRHGFQCAVEEENLLTGSGLFNVYATRSGTDRPLPAMAEAVGSDVQAKADQFVQALASFTQTARNPMVVCLCPTAPHHLPDAGSGQAMREIEDRLLTRIRQLPRVHAIGSATILSQYPSSAFFDPHADHEGHIPYTPEGFAAIGSTLFRAFTGIIRPPYKVIVLDCDNTLWRGACGEEGPTGVEVTPAYRALQEFMIRQMGAGMLLCLCSKNSEADVWAVFERHSGMALKREHLAASRINWAPKSANLQALARELNLGLDALIFVDDNPVECAEVRANCPAVLTLELPSSPENLPQFLDHCWAFDHLRVTEEDRTRTQKVQENAERNKYRGQVATLKDFIDGLQLQVTLAAPAPAQLARVAQLTQRTNQFNFTTVRRTEGEILHYLEKEAGYCLAVNVTDRFGDYGLVGLVLYHAKSDRYVVDTLLLSCRVLGRGVEHQILAEVGRRAVGDGKRTVELPFRPTEKNQPARDFLQSVSRELLQSAGDGTTGLFPATILAGLRYDPSRPSTVTDESAGPAVTPASLPAGVAALSGKYQRIAAEFNGAKQVVVAAEAARMRVGGLEGPAGVENLPATLEGKLLGIWRRTLGNPRMSPNDNFFEGGGSSLKAVQTVAAIRRELHLNLSIVNIFECPTVRLLAAKLNPEDDPSKSNAEALARGAKRKQGVRRRP